MDKVLFFAVVCEFFGSVLIAYPVTQFSRRDLSERTASQRASEIDYISKSLRDSQHMTSIGLVFIGAAAIANLSMTVR